MLPLRRILSTLSPSGSLTVPAYRRSTKRDKAAAPFARPALVLPLPSWKNECTSNHEKAIIIRAPTQRKRVSLPTSLGGLAASQYTADKAKRLARHSKPHECPNIAAKGRQNPIPVDSVDTRHMEVRMTGSRQLWYRGRCPAACPVCWQHQRQAPVASSAPAGPRPTPTQAFVLSFRL